MGKAMDKAMGKAMDKAMGKAMGKARTAQAAGVNTSNGVCPSAADSVYLG